MKKWIMIGIMLILGGGIWCFVRHHAEGKVTAEQSQVDGAGIPSIRTKAKPRTIDEVMGIHSYADLSEGKKKFVSQMGERCNWPPFLTTAELKEDLEKLAEREKINPEKLAVELFFGIQRMFKSEDRSHRYPMWNVALSYGEVITPYLLDRLLIDDYRSEYGSDVYSLLLAIETPMKLPQKFQERLSEAKNEQERTVWHQLLEGSLKRSN